MQDNVTLMLPFKLNYLYHTCTRLIHFPEIHFWENIGSFCIILPKTVKSNANVSKTKLLDT